MTSRPTLEDLLGLLPYGQVQTHTCLDLIAGYEHPALSVGEITLTTLHHGRRRPRSLAVTEKRSGRLLGEVTLGWLCLTDERDRPAVIERLTEVGVPVARPLPAPKAIDITHPMGSAGRRAGMADCAAEDAPGDERTHRGDGAGDVPPRLWLDARAEIVSIRPLRRDGQPLGITMAQYNPSTRVLYVEDQPLVAACVHYAARVGLDLSAVKVASSRWHMDREYRFAERADLDRRPATDPETLDQPLLKSSLRAVLPDGLADDHDVRWIHRPIDGPGTTASVRAGLAGLNVGLVPEHDDSEFRVHETHVASRDTLFPDARTTDQIGECRLCWRPGLKFTTSVCRDPLVYCHECLDTAFQGVFGSLEQAAIGLRLVSEHEYLGAVPLPSQLQTIRCAPGTMLAGEVIDTLLVARFVIKRRVWAWTQLLAQAGLLGDGLPSARGTITVALDGHLCRSLQERAVDDFFTDHGIVHESEPLYPHDPVLNPLTRRRGDWLLADGTIVEMWGLPNDPTYARRMHDKQLLAAQHQIRLIGLTAADIPHLPTIFADWIHLPTAAKSTWTPPSPRRRASRRAPDQTHSDDTNNTYNDARRDERLDRCRQAVALQARGMPRRQISQALGVSAETVKILLRDGKFYADPTSDPARHQNAVAAASARRAGHTRDHFRHAHVLTPNKATEAWRDATTLNLYSATHDGADNSTPNELS